MGDCEQSRQFPQDWLKICELYPNIIRDSDEKNNNESSSQANNNNYSKFNASQVNRRSVSSHWTTGYSWNVFQTLFKK